MSYFLNSITTTSSPLPYLGPHLLTILFSTVSCFIIQYISRWYGPVWAGKIRWEGFDQRTRSSWASHVVSMSHALIIIPLAMHCLKSPIIANDPVFGYDPTVARVGAVSCGYFIWDTIDSSLNSTAGFVLHAVCCVAVFLFSFRPFLAGFGPPFLLWELSTPFLNIHWFMDKLALSQTHPTLYLVNALVFMLVFFLARIVYGGYQSILVIQVMWQKRHEIPLHLHLIYTLGNISLNALNWLWFSKMVKKMIARVAGDAVPVKNRLQDEKKPLLEKVKQNGAQVEEKSRAEEEDSDDENEDEEEEEGTVALPAKAPSPMRSLGSREEKAI